MGYIGMYDMNFSLSLNIKNSRLCQQKTIYIEFCAITNIYVIDWLLSINRILMLGLKIFSCNIVYLNPECISTHWLIHTCITQNTLFSWHLSDSVHTIYHITQHVFFGYLCSIWSGHLAHSVHSTLSIHSACTMHSI